MKNYVSINNIETHHLTLVNTHITRTTARLVNHKQEKYEKLQITIN